MYRTVRKKKSFQCLNRREALKLLRFLELISTYLKSRNLKWKIKLLNQAVDITHEDINYRNECKWEIILFKLLHDEEI